jgi:hypothetical protein
VYAKIFLKWTRFLHWAAFVFLNKPNNKKSKMFTVPYLRLTPQLIKCLDFTPFEDKEG